MTIPMNIEDFEKQVDLARTKKDEADAAYRASITVLNDSLTVYSLKLEQLAIVKFLIAAGYHILPPVTE
jgi:hypothetical protein